MVAAKRRLFRRELMMRHTRLRSKKLPIVLGRWTYLCASKRNFICVGWATVVLIECPHNVEHPCHGRRAARVPCTDVPVERGAKIEKSVIQLTSISPLSFARDTLGPGPACLGGPACLQRFSASWSKVLVTDRTAGRRAQSVIVAFRIVAIEQF
jgi:hypothetical protein